MSDGTQKFYGLYRGSVFLNADPKKMGRIQVLVPDVLGLTPSTWAMPCVPFAGKQSGVFVVPAINSGVWVQFENGDPDQPVWTGGWWGSTVELPLATIAGNPLNPNIVIQSLLQQAIIVSDMPPSVPPPVMPLVPTTGGIILRSTTGASIVVNDVGIFISNGKGATIMMVGNSVTINNGALVVI
jgi:hypothetical protein